MNIEENKWYVFSIFGEAEELNINLLEKGIDEGEEILGISTNKFFAWFKIKQGVYTSLDGDIRILGSFTLGG